MLERLVMFIINIFCKFCLTDLQQIKPANSPPGPPVTVIILTGLSTDALINTILFIAGVIPGHIHGFYISCTYFNRKRKVRKGKYPGGEKRFIYSKIIWNGGASDERVDELWEIQREKERERERKAGRKGIRRSGTGVGRSGTGAGQYDERRKGMGRENGRPAEAMV